MTRPSGEMRRAIIDRAKDCCEYCLLHQDDAASTHQIDHIIAEKHGGPTSFDNLALSCTTCNRRKAGDISSLDPDWGDLVRLFNPRTQAWVDHFQFDAARIVGRTPEGRATVDFLQLNGFERLQERSALMAVGRYPPANLRTP